MMGHHVRGIPQGMDLRTCPCQESRPTNHCPPPALLRRGTAWASRTQVRTDLSTIWRNRSLTGQSNRPKLTGRAALARSWPIPVASLLRRKQIKGAARRSPKRLQDNSATPGVGGCIVYLLRELEQQPTLQIKDTGKSIRQPKSTGQLGPCCYLYPVRCD